MFGVTEMISSGLELLRAVEAVDWAAYAIPPSPRGYEPERVPSAFRRLLAVSNWGQAATAYGQMLFAVGNNHAGYLYPAAVPAASLLARTVRERSGWTRWAAMEILIEFLSFGVDRQKFTDPAGVPVQTKEAILRAVLEIHENLERLGAARSVGARPVSTWPTDGRPPVVAPVADSAADLLDALNEETSGR
jgi:hypothetical protein